MAQIILDISPNTHKNDNICIHRMVNAIKEIDTRKHEIVFKTQIFKEAPPNLPITPDALNFFGFCAKLAGYKWTASVFDLESLDMLMKYEEDLPFIKIACRPDLYWLAGEIKRKIAIYVSLYGVDYIERCNEWGNIYKFYCVPKYPALADEYYLWYNERCYSDHTMGFEIWNNIRPWKIEWHYKEATSTGPDAGDFAKTVDDLKEIL